KSNVFLPKITIKEFSSKENQTLIPLQFWLDRMSKPRSDTTCSKPNFMPLHTNQRKLKKETKILLLRAKKG
nr:hypothetical protein [Nostoc sp. DedSLP05]